MDKKEAVRAAFDKMIEFNYDTVAIVSMEDKNACYVGQNDDSQGYFFSEPFSYENSMKDYLKQSGAYAENFKIEQLSDLQFIEVQLQVAEQFCLIYFVPGNENTVSCKQMKFFYTDESKEFVCYTRLDETAVFQQAEEKKKELEKELKEAKRASNTANEFLSRFNHDLRTPLDGILGMTKLTMELDALPKDARNNLKAIDESGRYILNLLNDSFDMNKIESNRIILNPEIIDTRKFLEHIKAYILPAAKEKNIEFKIININNDDKFIRADRMRLQQIFVNLLTNAVRYTPENGSVECMVEKIRQENGMLYEKLTISDNGIGMSPAFLEKAFEPFSQESNELNTTFSGSGLGLFIVKNLVEKMGGEVELKSDLGLGTQAIVKLAFEEVTGENITDRTYSEEQIDLTGKNILLCEDHPLNTKITVKLLEKVGCKVETAENGQIGLTKFLEQPSGYYDMILMDIRMPVMDGLTATRKIRGLGKDDSMTIPIVAMTANAFDEDVRASKAAGLNEHLAKPVDTILLYDVLQRFLC